MEFNFAVEGLSGPAITVWDAAALVRLSSVEFHKFRNVLEEFGQRSAVAQGLRAPITDIWRLRSSDQQLYLQTDAASSASSCMVLGGLKVGKKKLFLHRANGAIVEVEPLCVLDFYVHESHQRQGIGKALFENMLKAQQLAPEQLGYDRPSPKLLAFIRRHYNLASFVPQPNNFVVFEQFFEHMPSSPTTSSKSGRTVGSSSGTWGPSRPTGVGPGRQTLHIIGSGAAAADSTAGEQWMRSSLRPPTPSQQHCIQLQQAQVVCSGSSNSGVGCSTQLAGSWSPLGGPGCATAGMPTHNPRIEPQQQQQQQQQLQPVTHYGRGSGMRELLYEARGGQTFHTGFQQALMAAAGNPAPPRAKAGPLPSQHTWQQTQPPDSSLPGCRDSLDKLLGSNSGGTNHSSSSGSIGRNPTQSGFQQQQQQQQQGCYSSQAGASGPPASQIAGSGGRGNLRYAPLVPPFAWPEPPSAASPTEASETDRVSLKRQAAQLAQQRLQQQLPAWVRAGAGPPGHLLASPITSYAVPTAEMAEVFGKSSSDNSNHPQQPLASADWKVQSSDRFVSRQHSKQQQQPYNSLCLSWDGLPTGLMRSQPQCESNSTVGLKAGFQAAAAAGILRQACSIISSSYAAGPA